MFASGNWLRALIALTLVMILLPPVRRPVIKRIGRNIPWFVHGGIVVCLCLLLYGIGVINRPASIYLSEEYRNQFMAFYDAQLKQWPVDYEVEQVETRYGQAHVMITGPEDRPPMLLCHAGALPSWSWKYNIEELSKHYRCYAVDAMGEVGKSVLYDVSEHTKDGHDIAGLYDEICEGLGIEEAYLVGASYGGFIGTNLAIHHPERVRKMVLIGPMGVTPATASTLFRITLLTLFPARPVQDWFIHWMIAGNNDNTREIVDWMRLVFVGARAKEAPPVTFSHEELSSVEVPVLLILGNKDNLVGDPQSVMEYTGAMPRVQTQVLDASHGIWAEQPERVNGLITEFLR
jgi:pimeloyl-ACP methyl ester carboxylesterase